MSYAERKQMSSNRTAALVVVALIHLALGYALVTGLAYNVLKQATEDLKTFEVQEEAPPPEEPPPEQPKIIIDDPKTCCDAPPGKTEVDPADGAPDSSEPAA